MKIFYLISVLLPVLLGISIIHIKKPVVSRGVYNVCIDVDMIDSSYSFHELDSTREFHIVKMGKIPELDSLIKVSIR